MPKSSVMRLESLAETSHSVAGGTSAVFDHDTVGNDISSATHGSSVASVAGKNLVADKAMGEGVGAGQDHENDGEEERKRISARAPRGERHSNSPLRHEDCGCRECGSRASCRQWRRSRAMGFGFGPGDENDDRGRRDALAHRPRYRNGGHRRWRQRRRQHQAAGAAIIADFASAAVSGRCGLAGDIRVADNPAGLRRCGLRAGKTGNQSGQRDCIGSRQRNDALLQQPPTEKLVHRPNPARGLPRE